MNIPLYVENPKDGVATYDTIDIFYSGDSYAAALLSVAIDITTRDIYSPGYTATVYTSGNNYTYKARFRNSSNGQVSGFSPLVPEGSSFAIEEVRRLLEDETEASEVFTDEDLAAAETRAVDRLFPRVLKDAVDSTSLDIEESVIDYDLPMGVFRITKLEKGSQANSDLEELDNFEILDGNVLRLQDSDVGSVSDLTLHFKRAYRHSGEVPKVLQSFLIYEMLAECYETLANTRGIKFKAFQALARETDIRPETFKQLAGDARKTAEENLSRVERG